MPAWVLPAIAAAGSLMSAINQGKTASAQGKLAQKFGAYQRPKYQIPKAFYENLSLARNRMSMGLPGEGVLRSRLDRALTNAASLSAHYGQSGAGILAAISNVAGKQMDQEAMLTARAAEYRDQATRDFWGQNLQMADQQLKAWDWDRRQVYENAMASASALREAYLRNKQGAIDTIAKIPMLFAGMQSNPQMRATTPVAPMQSQPVPTAIPALTNDQLAPATLSMPFGGRDPLGTGYGTNYGTASPSPYNQMQVPQTWQSQMTPATDYAAQDLYKRFSQRYPGLSYDDWYKNYYLRTK